MELNYQNVGLRQHYFGGKLFELNSSGTSISSKEVEKYRKFLGNKMGKTTELIPIKETDKVDGFTYQKWSTIEQMKFGSFEDFHKFFYNYRFECPLHDPERSSKNINLGSTLSARDVEFYFRTDGFVVLRKLDILIPFEVFGSDKKSILIFLYATVFQCQNIQAVSLYEFEKIIRILYNFNVAKYIPDYFDKHNLPNTYKFSVEYNCGILKCTQYFPPNKLRIRKYISMLKSFRKEVDQNVRAKTLRSLTNFEGWGKPRVANLGDLPWNNTVGIQPSTFFNLIFSEMNLGMTQTQQNSTTINMIDSEEEAF
eukprot:NODE_557_length_6097_cov_0.482161.p3 type:complete len:311 gc:universal NODE_557_length_6097_cov_0.482161:583-1515(+)